MATEYFKMIGQHTSGKLVLIAVVEPDFLGHTPSIFEVQAFKMQPNIYTGTYPQIKINPQTVMDITGEFSGMGISGIITSANWYNVKKEDANELGINI